MAAIFNWYHFASYPKRIIPVLLYWLTHIEGAGEIRCTANLTYTTKQDSRDSSRASLSPCPRRSYTPFSRVFLLLLARPYHVSCASLLVFN